MNDSIRVMSRSKIFVFDQSDPYSNHAFSPPSRYGGLEMRCGLGMVIGAWVEGELTSRKGFVAVV